MDWHLSMLDQLVLFQINKFANKTIYCPLQMGNSIYCLGSQIRLRDNKHDFITWLTLLTIYRLLSQMGLQRKFCNLLREFCSNIYIYIYIYIIELLREHLSLTALSPTLDVILIDKHVARSMKDKCYFRKTFSFISTFIETYCKNHK